MPMLAATLSANAPRCCAYATMLVCHATMLMPADMSRARRRCAAARRFHAARSPPLLLLLLPSQHSASLPASQFKSGRCEAGSGVRVGTGSPPDCLQAASPQRNVTTEPGRQPDSRGYMADGRRAAARKPPAPTGAVRVVWGSSARGAVRRPGTRSPFPPIEG